MNIYVGNLSLDTTEDELRKEFMVFGEVVSVTIMNDKYIGSSRPDGYGYVEMPSKAEGTTAIANLQGRLLRNHMLSVVEALPLSDKGNMVSSKSVKRLNSKRERTPIL